MATRAAFFDLDRTLIDANSGFIWARYELREGNITRGQFARAAFWTLMYHLSLIDMDQAFDEATRHYRGQSNAVLDTRVRRWFYDEINCRLRPRAAETVAEHRKQGDLLVLLTNSSCFEADVALRAWGFDHRLANNFPADEAGLLIGTYERPMCYGKGKVERAEQFAVEHDVDLEESFYYADSLSDLPMLERVGHPRAVTPDPRLRRAARRRGWPILEW